MTVDQKLLNKITLGKYIITKEACLFLSKQIYGILDKLESENPLVSTYVAGTSLEGRLIRVAQVQTLLTVYSRAEN